MFVWQIKFPLSFSLSLSLSVQQVEVSLVKFEAK